jgi:hypothetical protein
MRAYIKIPNEVLSRMIFGPHLEAHVVSITECMNGQEGHVEFALHCNPDLIAHKENADIKVIYKTEAHIIGYEIEVIQS